MRFIPLLLFIGIAAAEDAQFWGWKEKGCKGLHWWMKRPADDLFYCSDADFLKKNGIQSVMFFLPDKWSADLYAENGCPFPKSDDDSKRKSMEKELCHDIDSDKYPSYRMQRSEVPWLYGWRNEDCTGDPAEISPDSTLLDEVVGTAPGYCASDHKPYSAIAFDLPDKMAATLYKKDNCTHEMLQVKAEDSKQVGNRICTKNDAKDYPSYRLGLSAPKPLEK